MPEPVFLVITGPENKSKKYNGIVIDVITTSTYQNEYSEQVFWESFINKYDTQRFDYVWFDTNLDDWIKYNDYIKYVLQITDYFDIPIIIDNKSKINEIFTKDKSISCYKCTSYNIYSVRNKINIDNLKTIEETKRK